MSLARLDRPAAGRSWRDAGYSPGFGAPDLRGGAMLAEIDRQVKSGARRLHSGRKPLIEAPDPFVVVLGHAHVEATMIYTHVLNKGGHGMASPLDRV